MRRYIAMAFIVGSLVIVGTIVIKRNSKSDEIHDGSGPTEALSGTAGSRNSTQPDGSASSDQPTASSTGIAETNTASQREGAPESQAGAPATTAAEDKFGAPASIPASGQPDTKHAPGASGGKDGQRVVDTKNNAAPVDAGAPQGSKDSARTTAGANLSAPAASASSSVVPDGKKVATVTPDKGNNPQATAPAPAAPPEKPRPNFPGIEQKEDILMVSNVRHKEGEGEDNITVTLTRTEGSGEISGDVWIIGEYVQRGTNGVMFMPSHNELKLGPDGKPKNPKAGMPFQLRGNVEKKMTVRRPGFDGEELIAVRVGVVNSATGEIHMARVSTRQMAKKAAIKRAKVSTTP